MFLSLLTYIIIYWTSLFLLLSPTISLSFTSVSDHFPVFTHLNLNPHLLQPLLILPSVAPVTGQYHSMLRATCIAIIVNIKYKNGHVAIKYN